MRKASSTALRQAQREMLDYFSEASRPGLKVWCIESLQVQPVAHTDHGFLHQGNVYIVLHVSDSGTVALHAWVGSQSQKGDLQVATSCMEELDRGLDGGALCLSVEFEGKESSTFLGHFQDGIISCEGRSKQLLSRACKYTKRLYVVRGRRHSMAACTTPTCAAVSDDAILLLDGFPRMYLWVGDHVDYVSRVKAINLAKKIRNYQRDGQGHIVVIDKNEKKLSESFLRKLQTCDATAQVAADGSNQSTSGIDVVTGAVGDIDDTLRLFRITGDRVMYDMPLAASTCLQQKYLTSTDVFLLTSGPHKRVYVWVGERAESDSRRRALRRAGMFTAHHLYPFDTPLCRVKEGAEPQEFKAMFSHWRDRSHRETGLVKSYSVANVGRVLYSRTDRRTVAKMEEVWSDDHFLSGNGATEMWQVCGDVTPVSLSPEGLFYNNSCYILRHKEGLEGEQAGGRDSVQVIYIWLGSKSSPTDQLKAQQLAAEMDAALDHETCLVRVLDGQEPKHFLSVLSRSMIVFDLSFLSGGGDETYKDNVDERGRWMYCVREVAEETMRVTQVSPKASSLNSSAAFIVITDTDLDTYIWFGKNATAFEREYSKSMLSYLCPTKAHDYDIITEGKEPSSFWDLVVADDEYPKEFTKINLERRHPRLSVCKSHQGVWGFEDIPDFAQEDLCEKDIMILDTNDQIHLWCGHSVPDRDHNLYAPVIESYMSKDPPKRQYNHVKMWIVNQGHEPSTFYKFFPSWEEHGYGGQIAYLAARKRVRQENAMIDPDCQMVDQAHIHVTKVAYKPLVKEENLPEDIQFDHKELHLTDKEFTRVLRMPRAQFYRLPFWKQRQILKSAHLSPSSSNPSRQASPRSELSLWRESSANSTL